MTEYNRLLDDLAKFGNSTLSAMGTMQKQVRKWAGEQVDHAIKSMDIVTQKEVADLNTRIADLEKRLAESEAKNSKAPAAPKEAAAKPAATKAAAKPAAKKKPAPKSNAKPGNKAA